MAGIEFAEQIIDGMVDEDGHCGERGLSERQFDVLARYLEEGEAKDAGGWEGDYSFRRFTSTDFKGNIGRYRVWLNEYWHFNRRCTVVSIDLRPEREVELERNLRELGRFEHSEWQHETKQRVDLELVLVRQGGYERAAYTYGYEWVSIYTLADADGNCYVWKTTSGLGVWEERDGVEEWVDAEPGDKVTMRATVKCHDEFRGVKQTVVTRPKVAAIEKHV